MVLDLRILPRIDLEQNHKNKRNRTETHPLGRETSKSLIVLDLSFVRRSIIQKLRKNKPITDSGLSTGEPMESPGGYDKRGATEN